MSASDVNSTRTLRVGVCLPRTPTRALKSRDAVDTRIPAVWQLPAAHHGISAMPAARTLLACSLHVGVLMNLDDHR